MLRRSWAGVLGSIVAFFSLRAVPEPGSIIYGLRALLISAGILVARRQYH